LASKKSFLAEYPSLTVGFILYTIKLVGYKIRDVFMRFFSLLLLFLMPSASLAEGMTEMEKLGELLFSDTSFSNPPGQACASCHVQSQAFTGTSGSIVASVAQGSTPDKLGNRNVPTIMYSKFSPAFSFVGEKTDKGEIEYTPTGGLFLDGRANNLVEQVHGPLLNPVEMANTNAAMIAERFKSSPNFEYYQKVFGASKGDDDLAFVNNMAIAIAAYESASEVSPFTSKFDDYLRGDVQLSPQEAKGFDLFKNPEKGNCLGCHAGVENSKNPRDWLFTDFTYDNLGVPRNNAIPANAAKGSFDDGLCQREGLQKLLPHGVTLASLCGAFKVPTLRNIAVTGPYFHNGKFERLRDAVSFYVTRDTNPELWYSKSADGKVQKFDDTTPEGLPNVNASEVPYDRKLGEQPRLTSDEIDAVVTFLKTLTDKPFK
jgi:cytochrome c peroxidase